MSLLAGKPGSGRCKIAATLGLQYASAELPRKTCLYFSILAFAPHSGPRIAKRLDEWPKRGPDPVFDSLACMLQQFRSRWLEVSGGVFLVCISAGMPFFLQNGTF